MNDSLRVLPALAMFALLAISVQAAGDITDLGKPTNALDSSPPLAGFHHAGPALLSGHLPELLFIGTQADPNSAVERWAVVKALDQFGRLSNVSPSASKGCAPTAGQRPCTISSPIPTFDWTHARYAGRYLAFAPRELTDPGGKLLQRLSPAQQQVFYRYLAVREATYAQTVRATVQNTLGLGLGLAGRSFPLISIGGYLRADLGQLTAGDLPIPPALTSSPVVPFSTVQQALLHNKPEGGVSAGFLADVNAEANVLTALICHADGRKPTSVCGRGVIKQLLRHVR
jgi:hypothetical protein